MSPAWLCLHHPALGRPRGEPIAYLTYLDLSRLGSPESSYLHFC